MDCRPPGFSVHRNIPARISVVVAISSSRVSSQPRDSMSPAVPLLADGFFTTEPPGKPDYKCYIEASKYQEKVKMRLNLGESGTPARRK